MKSKTIKSKKKRKRVKVKDEHLSKSKKKKKLIVKVKQVKNPPPFIRQGNNLFRDDGKIFLGEIIRQDKEFLYVRKELFGSTIFYSKKLCVSEC